jgi:hypothetical protein
MTSFAMLGCVPVLGLMLELHHRGPPPDSRPESTATGPGISHLAHLHVFMVEEQPPRVMTFVHLKIRQRPTLQPVQNRGSASVEFHRLARAGEPDTCSREPSDRVCAPMESVEDVRLVVLRDSETFVAHDQHRAFAIWTIRFLYRDADRPTLSGSCGERYPQQCTES